MLAGASQIDITPQVGVELAGFAARTQPSTGVLDPLYAKALYLEQEDERLLWLHADLIGVGADVVQAVREWAGRAWGLAPRQVIVSTTHTHAGPVTIAILEAGAYDAEYVAGLIPRLKQAAEAAVGAAEPCAVVAVEGHLELAVDRRTMGRPHTDPRVGGIGFRRADGRHLAVIANYAMHAVALGPQNRRISGDVPGRAARHLARRLPGEPVVLITAGACGNLNPPAKDVPEAQIEAWGTQVADAIAGRFGAVAALDRPVIRTLRRVVPLPLEVLGEDEIQAYAAGIWDDAASFAEWGERFRRAVAQWREKMIAAVRAGTAPCAHDAELLAVRMGDVVLLGVNAEVFSRFAEDVRARAGRALYVVAYANGDIGYIPTRAAYAEGGYEVETAHLFHGSFRTQPGGLERLAEAAAGLVGELFAA